MTIDERKYHAVGNNDITLGASGEGIYALNTLTDHLNIGAEDGVKTVLKEISHHYWMRCAYQGWFKFLLVKTPGTLTNNLNASISGAKLDECLEAAINNDFSYEEISDWITLTSQGLATNGYGDNYSFSRYFNIKIKKKHINLLNRVDLDTETVYLVILVSSVANAAAAFRMLTDVIYDEEKQTLGHKF